MADPYGKKIPVTGIPNWEREFRAKFITKNGIITTKDGIRISKAQWKKMFVEARTKAEKSIKHWSDDRNQGVNPDHWWKSPAIINRMLNSTEIDPNNPERYLNVNEYNQLKKERKVEEWQIFASQLEANRFNKAEESKNILRVHKVNKLVNEGIDRKEALKIVGQLNTSSRPAPNKSSSTITELKNDKDEVISSVTTTQTPTGPVTKDTTLTNKDIKNKAINNPKWEDIEKDEEVKTLDEISKAKKFMSLLREDPTLRRDVKSARMTGNYLKDLKRPKSLALQILSDRNAGINYDDYV